MNLSIYFKKSGVVVSRFIASIIFISILWPVGSIIKYLSDPMQLNKKKRSTTYKRKSV